MSIPPADTDSEFAVAKAAWERGETPRSEAMLRGLAAREPAREDISTLLARVLQSDGRLDAASATMFGLCRSLGFEVGASLRAAQFIEQCHRQALADELCDRALANAPGFAPLLAVAGNIARELGDFDKARVRYLAALDAGVDLDTYYVLGALAHTMRYGDRSHPDFARFEAHFRDTAFSLRARAATGFGLAKALDDVGDYASAATVLREANALVRSVLPWSPPAWDAFVDARLRERVARASRTSHENFVPVFIVGLPRTGTTMTATQLARRTPARDRGELRMLRFIAEQLIGGGHLGDAGAIAEAAGLYRVHARQDDAPATWYIDQDPMNFRYLDLVEAMFPTARVIHCRRDRRDTALSLWSQDFAHRDAAFAYDLADIAHFAKGHDRLMRHWQATLSLPIHTLDYETFVADPAASLAALADFIGAPLVDEDASSAAPIHSASVWQARQPVQAASVDRWRRYAPFVPELTGLFPEESA
ncbi:MAG TPA: sulfotransferase [Rhodanobacteraceae bacterium]|nr:sulfotransferase [Rhodanobacteraceae bacterium]